MKIAHRIEEMRALACEMRSQGTLGFVPTMGYLHEGHLSLVRKCRQECGFCVVSIFVNPAQFGPTEDLASYPRDYERDVHLLEKEGVDALFFPTAEMMYPSSYRTWVEVSQLSDVLCGASRPGHFRGVATVVLKLVNIIRPHLMYMGIKDFQQVVVLERMLEDLNADTRIARCPIVREADGLAMSSRNSYLDDTDRGRAVCLNHAIKAAQKLFREGESDCRALENAALAQIQACEGKPDYVSCVDPITLERADAASEDTRIVLAVYIGKTRLIDNDALGA